MNNAWSLTVLVPCQLLCISKYIHSPKITMGIEFFTQCICWTSINQSINQTNKQSINQLIKITINQSVSSQSINQSINQSASASWRAFTDIISVKTANTISIIAVTVTITVTVTVSVTVTVRAVIIICQHHDWYDIYEHTQIQLNKFPCKVLALKTVFKTVYLVKFIWQRSYEWTVDRE